MSEKPGHPIDFLIISALEEELQSLIDQFPTNNKYPSHLSALEYYLAEIRNESLEAQIRIAYTCLFAMGNPQAAALAGQAIEELKPKSVIMFGLAGGVKARVNLADVVVPTQIFYYEPAKIGQDGSENRPDFISTDSFLTKRLQSFAADLQMPYKVVFGSLGIGEKVIANADAVAELTVMSPKLVGVEMESYGVILACINSPQRPRFIAIRGICDHADQDKGDHYRRQALHNAASFLNQFLKFGNVDFQDANKQSQSHKLIAIHHLSLDRRGAVQSSLGESLAGIGPQEIFEVTIDQTDLFTDGCLPDPVEALNRQNDVLARIDNLVSEHPGVRLGYFGLAHIPLMFHLGYMVNRRVVSVFKTNRQTGYWEVLERGKKRWPQIHVHGLPKSPDLTAKEIVLRVNISYSIAHELIRQVMPEHLSMLTLEVKHPMTDVIVSEEQLDRYSEVFQKLLVEINRFFPAISHVHVFFAGPPPLAFRCGQQISRTADPEIIVYNFSKQDTPNYGWALNLLSGEVIDFRK